MRMRDDDIISGIISSKTFQDTGKIKSLRLIMCLMVMNLWENPMDLYGNYKIKCLILFLKISVVYLWFLEDL